MVPLLEHLWERLKKSEELNLPGEKAQLANYRCEAAAKEVKAEIEQQLEAVRGQIINYGSIVEEMNTKFKGKTIGYAKQIVEKWS